MADIDIGKILEALNSKADVGLSNAGQVINALQFLDGLLAKRTTDDSFLQFYGGTSYNKGAYIRADGESGPLAGGFRIAACNSTNGTKSLEGKPDGGLTWAGKQVLREQAGSLGENGYIKLSTGLIIQWGHVYSSATEYITITFPVPFWGYYAITKNYPSNQTAAVQYRELGFYEKTATGATAFNQAGVGSGFDWIAIGY